MTHDETAERVLAANEAFYAAINARNRDAMAALWSGAQPVYCVHPGWNVLSGRDAVLESWYAIMANPDQARVLSGAEQVHVLGDVAYVVCRELVDGAPLAATNVFALEEGRWVLVHHHASAIVLLPSFDLPR